MELSVAQVLLRLAFLAAYLILGILFFVYFMGMHGNTIDGNSFRLLNPFTLLDKSQFNDEGNRYRVRFLKLWLAAIALVLITLMVFGSDF
jgi:hypothetical protein